MTFEVFKTKPANFQLSTIIDHILRLGIDALASTYIPSTEEISRLGHPN